MFQRLLKLCLLAEQNRTEKPQTRVGEPTDHKAAWRLEECNLSAWINQKKANFARRGAILGKVAFLGRD